MSKYVFLLLLVLGMCAGASASRIQISEPQCTSTDVDVLPSALNNFGPFVPINGGGQFGFCNKTGEDWTSILIAVRTTVSIDNIVCDPGAFLACIKATTPDAPGVDYLYFLGTIGQPPIIPFYGVRNNERFTVNLDCAPGDICSTPPDWPQGTTFFGYGNFQINSPLPVPPVPEPASVVLLAAGLGAAYWRKKSRA
jgi:hypothetical protein